MPGKVAKTKYENNPFFIASNGITLLFNLAQGVAIMLTIFSLIGLFGNSFVPGDSTASTTFNSVDDWNASEWLLFGSSVAIIGLAVVMISALFNGVNSYTSARLSQGDEVALREAFREAFDKLWSFIWLQLIIFVKVLLWSLLFIIPGIIMAVRYSLAGVAFFDDTKGLRGNDAIKESLRMTKGAWLTTFAGSALFNLLTLGAIGNIVSTGANAVLYRQYQQLGNKPKPAAHWLSWLALVLPFALFFMIFFALIALAVIIGLLGQQTF